MLLKYYYFQTVIVAYVSKFQIYSTQIANKPKNLCRKQIYIEVKKRRLRFLAAEALALGFEGFEEMDFYRGKLILGALMESYTLSALG